MKSLAFVDVETTGLDPGLHALWEIAAIRRSPSGREKEYLWQIRPDLENADSEALRIGGYHERNAVPEGAEAVSLMNGIEPLTLSELSQRLTEVLQGSVLTGNNPGFDAGFLTVFLQGKQPWHYRTVDVITMAAGYLWATRPEVMRAEPHALVSRKISEHLGVIPPPDGVAHTALGDARWAMSVWDAVTQQK